MAVRVFKVASLLLAGVGLAILLFVARRSGSPAYEIGALTGTMNWAYIRIEGIASQQPSHDVGDGSVRFWLQDGSGEILVVAYRTQAQELLARGLLPVMGDRVTLEGTLRVREDFRYLVVDVPEAVDVQPPTPIDLTIGQVNTGLRYQAVRLRGVIRDDRTPYEGLRILTVRDTTGKIDVTVSQEPSAAGGRVPVLHVGQSVQVVGTVDEYRGVAQVSVGRASDLVILGEELAVAPARRIVELTAGDVGQMISVEGTVTRVDPFSAGVKCTLSDGEGLVTLLMWQDFYDGLADASLLEEGATVRVQGEVSEYRGELEVVPELPADVQVVAPASREALARRLGGITAADVGHTVAIEGVLKALRGFSAGVRGVLDDGTGTLTILLWQEIYDNLEDRAGLVPGAILRLEGQVAEYKGELEIVPRAAADVTVVGMGDWSPPQVAVDQVQSGDIGQIVEVAGRITAVVPFSRALRLTLADDTGTIAVLLWQNLYGQLDDAAALVVGTELVVRGEVAEYGGELEIVPQLPPDVRVGSTAEASKVGTSTPLPTAQGEPAGTPEPAATATVQPTARPTATPTAAPEVRTIGAISGDDVGATLAIARAGIAEVDYFSKGIRYTLTDGSGSIILLVWQDVLEYVEARFDLFPGSQVQVAGRIDQYEGDLEIVPRRGADLVLLQRGQRAPLEERTVSAIGPPDEGRVFTVEGTITRMEEDGWRKMWLKDGTGEVLIYVPARVVPYLPAGLGP
ncbi:MAG: OB-fold nucleic acid binding domain-containing protein, partial [Anaerolineae bacterium]|nr:OB-fold nucleic acid binding domain-containing protein [Anaerolineae bacterium]